MEHCQYGVWELYIIHQIPTHIVVICVCMCLCYVPANLVDSFSKNTAKPVVSKTTKTTQFKPDT